MPDDLSSLLSPIRERYRTSLAMLPGGPPSSGAWAHVNSADDVPHLLAAVEAALKAAYHFAGEADRFGKLSETADEESGAALAALAAWQAYDRCAKTFREAITTALAGEGTDRA